MKILIEAENEAELRKLFENGKGLGQVQKQLNGGSNVKVISDLPHIELSEKIEGIKIIIPEVEHVREEQEEVRNSLANFFGVIWSGIVSVFRFLGFMILVILGFMLLGVWLGISQKYGTEIILGTIGFFVIGFSLIGLYHLIKYCKSDSIDSNDCDSSE